MIPRNSCNATIEKRLLRHNGQGTYAQLRWSLRILPVYDAVDGKLEELRLKAVLQVSPDGLIGRGAEAFQNACFIANIPDMRIPVNAGDLGTP